MSFAWQCRRCKGPPIPGGPDAKPWIGPCPNCGGYYDAQRVSVSAEEVEGAQIQPIVDGEVISLNDAIASERANPEARPIITGSEGFDWVLGAGIPPGILTLLASPPGGGKSTLCVEILRKLAQKRLDTLYCSTEETTQQLGRRYARLGKMPPQLGVVCLKNIDEIVELFERRRPRVGAVDSLHFIEGVTDDNDYHYSVGSDTAVTFAAKRFYDLAHELNTTIFVIGHMTKDGAIAGVNTLQHAVDVTLYMNGQKKVVDGVYKIVGVERTLRSSKNRFCNTERLAHFRMLDDGLHDLGAWSREHAPWETNGGQEG